MIADKVHINQLYSDFYVNNVFQNQLYKINAENEARFVMDTLNLDPEIRVVDLACGPGYHAQVFGSYFKSVYGVDLSSACINIALQTKGDCHFVEEDTLDFASKHPGEFDLVTNFGVSFGYSDIESENNKILDALGSLVKKRGYLVIQFLNKSWAINKFINLTTFWSEDTNFFILDSRKISSDNRMLKSSKIFIDKNQIATHRFEDLVYLYAFDELKSAFLDRGFQLKKAFATVSGDQFVEEKTPTPFLFFQKA